MVKAASGPERRDRNRSLKAREVELISRKMLRDGVRAGTEVGFPDAVVDRAS
jgi:hypothetical protein